MLLDIDTVENVEIELTLFLSQYLSIKSLDDNKKNLIKLRLFISESLNFPRGHTMFLKDNWLSTSVQMFLFSGS